MKNETMLKEAPVWKLIVKMSLPMVVIMLMNVVYNMADTFFIGQTGDAIQVAAVSLVGPVFSLLAGVNVLIGNGACTAAAIALGKRDAKAVKEYSSFAFWSSLALGVLAGGAVLLFAGPLLNVLGINAETVGPAASYIRILALGTPAMVVGGVLGNMIRADGSAVGPMLIGVGGNVLNVVLDALFILVFNWGAAGAALATVCGYVFTLAGSLFLILRKKAFSISPRHFTLRPRVSLRVLGLGVPMAAGVTVQACAGVFANRLLVSYGNLAVAANNVAGKAGMLLGMVVMGICMGVQPAISFSFGAGDLKRLRQIVRGTGIISVAFNTALALVFFLCREGFVTAFLNDPQVVELGSFMVLASVVSAPVVAIYQLCTAYLQGTGMVSYATLTALLQKGLIYVPVLYLMNALWGLSGVVFAGVATDTISTAVACALCLVWAKKQKRDRAAAPVQMGEEASVQFSS